MPEPKLEENFEMFLGEDKDAPAFCVKHNKDFCKLDSFGNLYCPDCLKNLDHPFFKDFFTKVSKAIGNGKDARIRIFKGTDTTKTLAVRTGWCTSDCYSCFHEDSCEKNLIVTVLDTKTTWKQFWDLLKDLGLSVAQRKTVKSNLLLKYPKQMKERWNMEL